MQETNGKYSYLDQLSTAQLEELLRADMESSEDCDPGAVFQILEVIERRETEHPTKAIPDTDSAWAEFQQYYNIPEGSGISLYPCELPDSKPNDSKSRPFHPYRWLKRMGVAAAAVMVLFCGLIAVQAVGIDVFGAIGLWTSNRFHLISLKNDAIEKERFENIEYCQIIKDALGICGITGNLAPTWYPIGFELIETQILNDKDNIKVYASFDNFNDQQFNIVIVRYQSQEALNAFSLEVDSAIVEEYVSGAKTFYILTNADTTTAIWSEGLLTEKISGDLTIDSMKKIIDSIGGN